MTHKFLRRISTHTIDWQSFSQTRFWLLIFAYTLCVSLLIQFVVLPTLAPSLHAGHGLLLGGDWVGFHELATTLAQNIHAHGWQAWELRPQNQGPAGIAAIFYTLITPEPWSLAPLNAVLHASATLLLAKLIFLVCRDKRLAFLGALPFALFPSSAMWYAQIHRDGFYFAGVFACLFGWLQLTDHNTWQRWHRVAAAYFLIWVGIAMIWIMRDYGVELMRATGGAFAIITFCSALWRWKNKTISATVALTSIVLTISIPTLLVSARDARFQNHESYTETAAIKTADKREAPVMFVLKGWSPSAWLPSSANNAFFKLAVGRAAYLQGYANAGSAVDSDVVLTSPSEFLSYLPRAAQLGLLAPFPQQWVKQGSAQGGAIMRKISGAEMLFCYFALSFLPYAFVRWRHSLATWAITGFGLSMILIYTFVTPNVGALYRMRYGFLMLLVGLGVAGALHWRSTHQLRLPRLRLFPDLGQSNHPLCLAFGWYFAYAATTAFVLQTFVLPIFFPNLNAGMGLLTGTDAHGFHEIASNLATAIRVHGWGVWELRPDGQAPAGIAAIFYTLLTPHPLVIIPINAALHALAGITLMRIALFLMDDKQAAFYSALPFILFPSAMMWYAQIHKDGFYLAGLYLCLLGWILLARLETWTSDWRPVGYALLCWIGGLILAGLVRIYAFQLLQGIGYLLGAGLGTLFIVRALRRQLPWSRALLAILLLAVLPYGLRYAPKETRVNATVSYRGDVKKTPPDEVWLGSIVAEQSWQKTPGMPAFIENNFLRIGVLREGYLTTPDYRNAGSMIDIDTHLFSITSFADYLPRATQIGFGAPFPSDWVAPGTSPGGSIMRKISGLEMSFTYLSLFLLPFAIWRWRRRVELWIPLTFGSIFTMIYAFATPNLGSLYRLRYGFLMLLICLGTLGGLHLLDSFRRRK